MPVQSCCSVMLQGTLALRVDTASPRSLSIADNKQPWPLIERFLSTLPPGSVGLDAGAGNGKYLPATQAAGHFAIAMDRSGGLLDIARGQLAMGAECVRGDLCQDPWRRNSFVRVTHTSTSSLHRRAGRMGAAGNGASSSR